ncbi:1-acyl-sn-glycerol-3-phosphate acyltransferase epsilon [Schistosoma japonicum]|nr:1-acyl-sn-glycerol-3-phosphate acyltransferase epsilon [Schistosoma japonicum]
MVIYPEGTRYNPWKRDVIKQSQKFAVEKAGIKPFKHVLVPRRRGLQLILNQMHDCLDVLYDVTTIFADENGYPHDHSIPAPGLTKKNTVFVFIDNVQSRFYKPLHDQDNQCTNDNTIDYEDNIVMNYVPRLSKDLPTIKQNFLDCFTNEMTKHCLELEQFRLFDVLPYAVLFYGITIYWIVGFSWYGLLSYLAVGLFGTIGGHLYMHFAI